MSKQNSKKPALPGSTVTMGLDIGYGVVKAVTADPNGISPKGNLYLRMRSDVVEI